MKKEFKNIVILGFGNIGQGLSYLLRKSYKDVKIDVFDEKKDDVQIKIANEFDFNYHHQKITESNYKKELKKYVSENTLILNLATSIKSHDLIIYAQENKAFYLDTCIDPWEYDDGVLDSSHNTNYQMRLEVINLIKNSNKNDSTCIVAHGANPGFVSILFKKAMIEMAKKYLKEYKEPTNQKEWAKLAHKLDIKVIQISERDTQETDLNRDENEFMNTWSVAGFVAEALQPVELGWGKHEEVGILSKDAIHHDNGCQSAVYFKTFGHRAEVKTWTPLHGEINGRLISHNEAISIASYLTVKDNEKLIYRPTVYYAYHPCNMGFESLNLLKNDNRNLINKETVIKDSIINGIDELGVLIISGKYGNLWMGSQLSIERTRELSPYNNATSLQVVGSILSALEWILENPNKGILESEDLDYEFIYEKCKFYWEPIIKAYNDWKPNGNNQNLTLDEFVNFKN